MDNNHVYILRAKGTDYYKVGRTAHVYKRIQTLQTGCPYEISVVGIYRVQDALRLEMFLHYQLDKYKVRLEWFELSKETLDEVVSNLKRVQVNCDCSSYCRGDEPTFQSSFTDFINYTKETDYSDLLS